MEKFKEFLKGIVIGISNMIPGLSGASLAIMLGIYDKMIDNIADLAKHPIKSIKNLFFIFAGNLVGILLGFIIIAKLLLLLLPVEISLFFAGIIMGGISPIFKTVFPKGDERRFKFTNFVAIIVPIIFLIALAIIKCVRKEGTGVILETKFYNFALLFLLGLLSTTSMVLPGVSGAMILMAFGHYVTVTELASGVINQIIRLNFTTDALLLLAFVVGCIVGVVLASKLIKFMVEKYPRLTNSIIFGLLIGSIISVFIIGINTYLITDEVIIDYFDQVLYTVNFSHEKLYIHLIVGSIFILLGVGIGVLITKNDKKELDFTNLTLKYYNEALVELGQLVKIPSVLDEFKEDSVEPFGHNNKLALDYTLELGKKLGFETLNDDNYACMISYGEGKESLGILAHLDVVPAVGNWTYGPFNPVISDGKLYGRGTLDDKCGVIVSLYAMKMLKDAGFKPKKKIELICGCDEESGSRCLEHYFKSHKQPEIAFSPDASFPLIYGEKAILSYDIEGNYISDEIISFKAGLRYNIVIDEAILTVKNILKVEFEAFLKEKNITGKIVDNTYYFYGKAAHASTPELGINAGIYMLEFISKYYDFKPAEWGYKYSDIDGKKLGVDLVDQEMGALTMNLGIISYENNHFKLGYNLRVPTDSHIEVIKSRLKEVLSAGLELTHFDYNNAHYVDPNSFLVKTLMQSYQEVTSDYQNKPFVIGGGTYAKFLDNAVAFGPCFPYRDDICHEPDEHIYLEDFKKWIEIYAKAIYLLTK